jgi:hypothetical protein
MRRISSLATLGLALLTGCSPFGQALKQAGKILPAGGDVAFAVVSEDGRVYPKTLIVRKGVHAIVWVADSDKLTITFSQTPPPVTVTCSGPICWASAPPATESGQPGYAYEGRVGSGSKEKPLDPRLEVVP